MKKVILVSALIFIGVFLFFGCSFTRAKQEVELSTCVLQKKDIINTVTATGTIEPVIKVEVGCQVSGIVKKLYVDYNSVVKKGDVIAELDKTTLLSDYQSQKANLANAQVEFDLHLKNYTRSKTLYDKGLIADIDYEQALYSYENAKNTLDISKSNLSKSKTNLSYATIYSPIDGVVLSKSVEEGQTVAASFSTPTLFYIANDLTQMRVIADVDEADIGYVKQGQRVEFAVDAYIGTVFSGTITQVRQNATTTNNVVTYEVVISAPNSDLMLKPGLTANVTIYTLEKKNILCVKEEAFKVVPSAEALKGSYKIVALPKDSVVASDKAVLWVVENNVIKAKLVTRGVGSRSFVEICDGIGEGEKVLVELKTVGGAALPPVVDGDNLESSPFMPSHPGAKQK